jgi:hypothetical protein
MISTAIGIGIAASLDVSAAAVQPLILILT